MESEEASRSVDERRVASETAGLMRVDGDDRDSELRAALSAGDHKGAVVACVREHGAALSRFAVALLGSRGEARDVVRAAVLAVCTEDAAEPGSIRALLVATARRDCARRLATRRGTGALRVASADERASDPDDPVGRRAARARTLLGELRPTERESLVARVVAQLSYAEVAVATDVDETEARARVSRALGALVTRLEGEKS